MAADSASKRVKLATVLFREYAADAKMKKLKNFLGLLLTMGLAVIVSKTMNLYIASNHASKNVMTAEHFAEYSKELAAKLNKTEGIHLVDSFATDGWKVTNQYNVGYKYHELNVTDFPRVMVAANQQGVCNMVYDALEKNLVVNSRIENQYFSSDNKFITSFTVEATTCPCVLNPEPSCRLAYSQP